MNPNDEDEYRQVPTSDLDLQMQITDPAWQNLSPQLRNKLVKLVGTELKDNIQQDIYDELSGILGLYTRDIRLGNLSSFNGEFQYVSYYLDLAVDLLSNGMTESCITAMNKALSILELSSSKGGFLRKLINTFRTEKISNVLEPERKNIMGGKNKGD